jgi:type IV secretory pathway TrbL component
VQLAATGLKVPVPLLEKLTEPVGVEVVVLSATVAVHVVAWFTVTVAGVQLTLVVVPMDATATPALLELPVWVESPP